MNGKFKRILSAAVAAAMTLSIGIIVPHAEDSLPTDGLIMNITFDEAGTGTGSFTATEGGTVKEKGSVSYVDNYDASSKALKISTDAAGNYLELPKGLLNGKEAATFSFWIKPSSRWAFMTTPVSGEQNYLNEKYIGMLASSSSFTAERYNNSGSRLSSITSNGAYTDWKYVTAVFTANGSKLYVNGKLEASDTAAVDIKSLFTADASTWIGHGNWGAGEGFSGMMDDFRVYGKALSEDEIDALSKKAVERETQKMLEEKNCLEIDTQFYANYDVTENGSDVTVSLPIVGEDKFTVIAASYTADDILSSVAVKKETDMNKETKSVTFTGLKKNADDTVRVFVWNSVSGLQPIRDNKVYQIAPGQTVTVKTNITNYTPSVCSIFFDIEAYDSEGNMLPSWASAPVELNVMESREFTQEILGESNVAYYKVDVSSLSIDETGSRDYDAGYLPVADVSFPDATPVDSANTTEGVHDPTIFKDPISKKYYAYSTHNLVFDSEDLINWNKHDYTRTVTVPEKAKEFISKNYSGTAANGTYWAPDLYYKEGDEYPYWFYLSTSCGLGGRNSVISLVKAKSPGLWDGEYIDAGVVVASKENSNYNTNAIDANIFTDTDGKTYFIWGSFWKGIHMAELDTDTGLVKGVDYTSDATILSSCQKFGTRMYSTPGGVQGPEGPYTVYNEDTGYRYMFTSYGWLGTNYNIRVARTDKTFSEILAGKDPHKQLLDQQNRPVGATYTDQVKEGGTLNELWGYKMSGSFQLDDGIEYLGSGHNSVFKDDDGQWYLVQHCRKVADAVAYLQVKKILWTEDGWPVISPMVYAGEDEQVIPEKMLYGTWDLSSVGQTILANGITDVGNRNSEKNADLPVHSSEIILQADGTLGNDLGTWEYDGDHTVTLSFEADGDETNYEFYKSGDTMKLFVLTGYDKDKRESALVMTGTDQNGVASFAKKNNQTAQSTKNIKHIETTPTVVRKATSGNPILGFDADGNTLYAGDPAAMVEGDTVYLYAGHDTSTSEGYVMPEWVCYSSQDMVNWTYEGSVMKATDVSWRNDNTSAWASQAIKYGNKYYLYFCTWDKTSSGKQSIGVAVSDSPTGPFVDKGTPLVKGTLTTPETSGWNDIDPTVWVETVDGVEHRYLAWGNGIFYVCELNEDMTSVKDLNGDGQIKMGDDIKQQEFTNLPDGLGFTEAPWIYRQKDSNGNYTGKYYLFAAFGWREQMGYATSDSMYGPWEWGGILMPPTATSNTNHPSVIDFNGKTYFIYHNGSLPWGSGFRRSVCTEEFTINEDGSIDPIAETSDGISSSEVVELVTSDSAHSFVYHENFVNSASDNDYPIKKQIYAGSISDILAGGISDSYWQIMPGKADSANENYVSIQSNNKPGLYICTEGTSVVLTQQATLDTALAKRMTFKTVEGINGSGTSFESVAKKGYFLTVKDGTLTLSDGSDADACSFIIDPLIGASEPTE